MALFSPIQKGVQQLVSPLNKELLAKIYESMDLQTQLSNYVST